MRIARVEIENFKRFESMAVDLGELDCLVGANNSGKTTLLQALALFDFCFQHCLERQNGGLRLRNRTVAPEDFYVLPVTDPLDLWHERRAQVGRKQRRIVVTVHTVTGLAATATVKLDFNRFGLAIQTADESDGALGAFEQCRIAYLPVFSMFQPREERRGQAAVEDELARGRAHSIIRNLALSLKQQARDGELAAILSRSFPAFRDLRIEFDDVTDRYIRVVYREEGRPKAFDIFAAGSGFQQFLYLFAFILARQPAVVLLDEPDVHLHGSLQGALLGELQRLVQGGRQVLLATHSRELIARIGATHILSLDEGPQRLRVALDVFDTLDRLGSVDPAQLATIQAYRRVVLLEGPTDRDLLAAYGRAVLGGAVWQQVERRVAFCYCQGNPRRQDVVRFRQLLQQVMAQAGDALRLFVLADRDYHPDPAALREALPNHLLTWHVWERTEIENYLLCPPALARLVSAADEQSSFDALLLQQEFERLVEATRDRANDRLVKAFTEMERGMDPGMASRRAREYLETHWARERLALADAKETVLPGLKRWLQARGLGQFSDRGLAETLTAEDLPPEVHDVARRLAEFAGVRVAGRSF